MRRGLGFILSVILTGCHSFRVEVQLGSSCPACQCPRPGERLGPIATPPESGAPNLAAPTTEVLPGPAPGSQLPSNQTPGTLPVPTVPPASGTPAPVVPPASDPPAPAPIPSAWRGPVRLPEPAENRSVNSPEQPIVLTNAPYPVPAETEPSSTPVPIRASQPSGLPPAQAGSPASPPEAVAEPSADSNPRSLVESLSAAQENDDRTLRELIERRKATLSAIRALQQSEADSLAQYEKVMQELKGPAAPDSAGTAPASGKETPPPPPPSPPK